MQPTQEHKNGSDYNHSKLIISIWHHHYHVMSIKEQGHSHICLGQFVPIYFIAMDYISNYG